MRSENSSGDEKASRGKPGYGGLMQRLIALAILAVGAVGAFLYWQKASHAPQVERPQVRQEQTLKVHVVRVLPESVLIRPRFLGQTEASQTVEIRSRVKGFLEKQGFVEGTKVEAGRVLFRIDPRSFQAEVDIAKAKLASAEARLFRTRQQVTRYEALVSRNSAAANDLEQLQTDEQVAQADVQLQKAQLAQAQLNLSYTTVESPITGLIGEAMRDVGSYVDDGTNSLLAVVEQVDPMYVRYTVSEQEMLSWRSLVSSGQVTMPETEKLRLQVTLADGTVYPYKGKIGFVGVSVSTSTGSTVVRGTVSNPDSLLKPGQFIHVTVVGPERRNALLVPQGAVIRNPSGASVYVVDKDNQAEQRTVVLGEWEEDRWVVESGLKPGDRVIANHLMQVRPGTKVEIVSDPNDKADGAQPIPAGKQP